MRRTVLAGRSARLVTGMALLACCHPAALAADSHALAVSATVLSKNTCRFQSTGPTALAFGAINPGGTAPVTVNLTLQYRCNGSSPVATWALGSDDGLYEAGAGQPRLRHTTVTTAFMPYSLTFPANGTVPRNTVTNMSISATLTPASFQNALAGAYADSVILNIAP